MKEIEHNMDRCETWSTTLLMKGDVIASCWLTHGGLPNPQHVIMSLGMFKISDTFPPSVEHDSRNMRASRAAEPAPKEWPVSTKRKPCQSIIL